MHPRSARVLCACSIAFLALGAAASMQLSAILATYQLSAGWATFGLMVPKGSAPAGVQVGTLPTQVDVKTRWSDGSIQYAIVTAQVQAPDNYTITAGNPQSGTFEGSWLAATTHLVINGQDWAASLGPASSDTWLSGPLVKESRVWSTPTNNGTPHPFLRVIYDVRSYRGGARRVDVTVENTLNIADTNKVTYDTSIVIDNAEVFSQRNVAHGSFSRWRKVFASGGLVESDIVPDFTPFQRAGALPTWLPSVDNAFYDKFPSILTLGGLTYPIGTTGGRPEIGPYPAWAAQYTVHKSPSQREYLLRHGDIAAGAWAMHIRETDGSMVTVDKKPKFWIADDRAAFDGVGGPANRNAGIVYGIEGGAAHHPSLAYVPYLITGDRYYLEEVQFWADAAVESWDWQRNGSLGLILAQNIRAVGWGLRNLVDAAVVTPDGDPLKVYFVGLVGNNLSRMDDKARSRSDLNGLGAVWIGDQLANTVPPWQQAYLAWAITHAYRQGFIDGGLWTRDAMSRFQLALFTNEPQYPRDYAGPYFPKVVKATIAEGQYTPFASFGEMWQANFASCGRDCIPAFAGGYGPEARLQLMIGIVNRWPGAQASYDWLMAWSSPSRGSMTADLRVRAQYALDVASMEIPPR